MHHTLASQSLLRALIRDRTENVKCKDWADCAVSRKTRLNPAAYGGLVVMTIIFLPTSFIASQCFRETKEPS